MDCLSKDSTEICVLVPTYNNDKTLKKVIEDILGYTNELIVINDGSIDQTKSILNEFSELIVCHHEHNQGKGAALRTGFKKALKLGYHHVISMDSDGQHRASDLPVFIEAISNNTPTLWVGARNMTQNNVPGTSSFGHKFSNFWYKVNTGINLPDTQSGYRSYPIELLKDVTWITKRFEFEIEILVRTAWRNIPVKSLPIDVFYPPKGERITHFRTVRDFTRISILNTIFVIIAIFYARPVLFLKKLKSKSLRQLFKVYIYDKNESNVRLMFSVWLGSFIGLTPLYGYHIILIIFFTVIFKLNKAIAIAAGHISIPPLIPFIVYASYKIGGLFMTSGMDLSFDSGLTLAAVRDNFLQYVIGSFVLAGIGSTILATLTLVLMLIFRHSAGQKLKS